MVLLEDKYAALLNANGASLFLSFSIDPCMAFDEAMGLMSIMAMASHVKD
jgi:hypothetical protein